MPRGDKTKVPAFRLWRAGRSLREIQDAIGAVSRTKPSSVAGWVRDWERGRQGTWTPRVRTVLLALSLLTSAATAHAECAWVLWQRGTVSRPRPSTPGWSPMQATSNQSECERARDGKVIEFMQKTLDSTPESLGPHTVKIEGGGVAATYTFVCLPDTVDPRVPKGGR